MSYQSALDRNESLRESIVALVHRYRCYGASMLYLKLRQVGERVNDNRPERLYAIAGKTTPAQEGSNV